MEGWGLHDQTCSPSVTPISSLTLFATLMAATLRGWVHPTTPYFV